MGVWLRTRGMDESLHREAMLKLAPAETWGVRMQPIPVDAASCRVGVGKRLEAASTDRGPRLTQLPHFEVSKLG